MAPTIVLPMLFFSGFFSNTGSYPSWISWIQWLSPLRYGLEGLVQNEFGHRDYQSGDVNMVEFLNFNVGLSRCLAILGGIGIGVRIISLICLKTLISKFQ